MRNIAEVAGILIRKNPKQVFRIFVTWNLGALWRRTKKFQRPWAPYLPPRNLIELHNIPVDTTTEIPRSSEKYLRATKEINHYAPEIIGLAMKLGLKEKSKIDFIKTAYAWVKNNIYTYMEPPPTGVVNILKKGYGICLCKMIIFVALARLAGIPARFISYKQIMEGGIMDQMAAVIVGKELAQEIAGESFTHGCIELQIDGKWMPLDITWTDEEEVGLDMRLTEFGDSPFDGKWYTVDPESITRDEDVMPMSRMKLQMAFQTMLTRGAFDRVNQNFSNIREAGRKILAEIGREAYKARKEKLSVPSPPLILDE